MAQYTVDHACGHSQTHQLYGKHAERDRKIEWLETTVCRECFKAERRAAENAAGPQFCVLLTYPFSRKIEEERLSQQKELLTLELEYLRVFGGDDVKRKVEQLSRDLEQMSHRRAEPDRAGRITIFGHAGTFPVKDILKDRGYRFTEQVISSGLLDLLNPTTKGWAKHFHEAEDNFLARELEWLAKQGWTVQLPGSAGQQMLSGMIGAIATGDPRKMPQQQPLSAEKFEEKKAKLRQKIADHQIRKDAAQAGTGAK